MKMNGRSSFLSNAAHINLKLTLQMIINPLHLKGFQLLVGERCLFVSHSDAAAAATAANGKSADAPITPSHHKLLLLLPSNVKSAEPG